MKFVFLFRNLFPSLHRTLKQNKIMETKPNLNLTFQEVKNIIIDIEKDAKERCQLVENFAKEKGIYVRVNPINEAEKKISEAFPELKFTNQPHMVNGIDSVANSVWLAIKRIIPNSLNSFNLDSINENTKKIKLKSYDSYKLHYFFEYWGIDVNRFNSNLSKEYNNGSRIYDFSIYNKDIFEKINKLFNTSNENTDKIINAITPEDKLKFLEVSKSSYGNPYTVMHDIKDRLNLKSLDINTYLVMKNLKM